MRSFSSKQWPEIDQMAPKLAWIINLFDVIDRFLVYFEIQVFVRGDKRFSLKLFKSLADINPDINLV